jgi:hypothetical protein
MVKILQRIFYKGLFFLAVAAFSCSNNIALAQANFTVNCPQKTIVKNDYLQLQFKVENASNVESITPPQFKDFSIVSGPNQESGMTSINGKVDQYVSIGFVLKPNSTGKFTIGPANAKADGKLYQTRPVSIEVTNSSSSSSSSSSLAGNSNPANSFPAFPNLNFDFSPVPATKQFDDYILKKGENVAEKIKKNLFIKLDVNKTSCYVGEPIIASFKLYTRLRSESTITDAPSFNGFSVSDLDLNNNNSGGTEKYDGRVYNVYTLRKVQLYPLQPGTFTLDPLKSDNTVSFIKAEFAGSMQSDLFGMMQNFGDLTTSGDAIVEQHVTLQSKPVEITVKSLPVENRPPDFKGTVGNFTIQSSLQKNNITTDDAGNLKIVINGSGNIQLLNAPKINWPNGIDGYEAKITDGIDKSSVPMRGSKTFTYPFTVSKAGTYTIPSVSFSFFDPATGSYKTLLTQPLQMIVIQGKGLPNTPKTNDVVKKTDYTTILNTYGLYLIGGIVLLAGLVALFFQRKKTKKEEPIVKIKTEELPDLNNEKPLNDFQAPENPLQGAHDQLINGKNSTFYSSLDNSLKSYLAAKLKIPLTELTKKRIKEELDKSSLSLGTSIRISALLDEIEMNIYTPPSHARPPKEIYEKAEELIALLNRQVVSYQ